MDNYKLPMMQQQTPHPLPGLNDDLTKLLEECDTNNRKALVALLGLEGMRLHEALELKLECIDMKQLVIKVWGKGSKVRIVPITERAFSFIAPAYMDAMMAGSDLILSYSDRGARLFITELGRRCRLTRDISSHDLRATFATLAYASCNDINLVRYWLGHESVETTQRYIGISMEDMRNAGTF